VYKLLSNYRRVVEYYRLAYWQS